MAFGREVDKRADVALAQQFLDQRGVADVPHHQLDPVEPGRTLTLDPALLARFPEGYRHLGYLQSKAGFDVRLGLPGLRGAEVEKLYGEGAAWLAGSPQPGVPL